MINMDSRFMTGGVGIPIHDVQVGMKEGSVIVSAVPDNDLRLLFRFL